VSPQWTNFGPIPHSIALKWHLPMAIAKPHH
jgi:hypothetical protein